MKYFIISILFIACGKSTKEIYREPAIVAAEEISDFQQVVDEENDYRENNGQAPLTQGLSCTVYTFTSGHRIQPIGTSGVPQITGLVAMYSFTHKGSFNNPNEAGGQGINVLPEVLRPMFIDKYFLRCTGYIAVVDSYYYSFESTSDDASLIYLDGAILVDNDNSHGVTTKSKVKFLRRGMHSFKVEYAQSGGGNQALIIKLDDSLLDKQQLFF